MSLTERPKITEFLSDLLVTTRLTGMGKYYAREVTFDYGSGKGKQIRIDFVQFKPENQYSISGIEKGEFICYEIKSCIEDVLSGHGLNAEGERNYIVTTMKTYKKIIELEQKGKKVIPHEFGVMVLATVIGSANLKILLLYLAVMIGEWKLYKTLHLNTENAQSQRCCFVCFVQANKGGERVMAKDKKRTCNDCVHLKVCQKTRIMNPAYDYAPNCDDFKSRSQFVELPCKVGDKVYFNNVHLQYAKVIAIYIDAVGGMFDLDITTKEETVAGYEHFINKDYSFEDIGKRIFLTKEQAEQALKERERK